MRNKRAGSPRRRLLGAAAVPLLIIIIVAAATAGCSGSSSSSSPVSSGADAPVPSAAASGAAAEPAAAGSAAGSGQNGLAQSGAAQNASPAAKIAPAARDLIYTAQLTVRAGNVESAVSRATSIVTAAGGYVSGENASAGNGQPSQATATITFKIPAVAYAPTLAALSSGGLGTQLSLSQQAQDVTQQVADVGSRVTSDEAAITQLRALLSHAGSVGDLLTVQNQINSEESDLESMLAQQKALNGETAYATVTLSLVGPKAAVKPPAKAAPPPGFARALSGGWHALHVTVSWLLTVFGAVAPFLAVVVIVGGLAWWGRRRRLIRRPQQPTDTGGTA